MDKTDPIYVDLQGFANEHKVILEDHGEIGFMRECVGFLGRGNCYVAHNPVSYETHRVIEGFEDHRLYAPEGVDHEYHKGDYLAILVHDDDYDAALRQLHIWVKHLESLGRVEIVQYATGATGIQALMSGLTGSAVRIVGSGA